MTFDPIFQAGSKSYAYLLHGRTESLGTRLGVYHIELVLHLIIVGCLCTGADQCELEVVEKGSRTEDISCGETSQ